MRKYLYFLIGSLFLFGACGGGEDAPGIEGGPIVPSNVSFSSAEVTEMENVGTIQVKLDLSAPAASDFTVTLDVTMENNMVEGTDYLFPNKEVHVAAGDSVMTVQLELMDNNAVDPGRGLELRIIDAGGGQILEPSRCKINVVDDESQAAVVFVERETDMYENDGVVRIPLVLQGTPAGTVHFKVTQIGGTAKEGTDYTWGTQELDLNSTSDTAYIELTLTDNDVSDPLRTLVLEVTEAQGGFTLTSSSNILINLRDDDVTLSFGSAFYEVAETDKLLLVPLRLSQPLTEDIEITLDAASSTAVEGTDFTVEKSLSILAGHDSTMVALYVTDMEGYEPDKQLTLSVETCSGKKVEYGGASCDVSILDCDTRLLFGEEPQCLASASSVKVDVRLERALEHDVTFNITSNSLYFSGPEGGCTIFAGDTIVNVSVTLNGQIVRDEAVELYITDERGAFADSASVTVDVLLAIDKSDWSVDINNPNMVTGGRPTVRNLFDGDEGSVWTNANEFTGADPVPYYVDIDLGGRTTVSNLRLTRPDASVDSVNIYVSTSEDYATAEWSDPKSLPFGLYLYTEYEWPEPQEITFIRVEVAKTSDGNVGRLSELTLY